MNSATISRLNVGRIAERIVANELEYHGFRVSDLNKEGTSANADLLAAKSGRSWQVQVKGATFDNGWWFGYGYCDASMIAAKKCRLFNKSLHFYRAQVVALVCVEKPDSYSCFVLPVEKPEEAAQINFEREYLSLTKNGSQKKPCPVFVCPDYLTSKASEQRKDSWQREVATLGPYKNRWDIEQISPEMAHEVSAANVSSSK